MRVRSFFADIDAVFVSDHAGFQTSKSRLHQQNPDGKGQHLGHRLKRWGQWHGIFRHGDSLKDVARRLEEHRDEVLDSFHMEYD